MTSEDVLLDWMTEGDNYSNYQGNGNHGRTKKSFCNNIAACINSVGVTKDWTSADVYKKIHLFGKQMKSAMDWETLVTGAGLMVGNETEQRGFY